MRAFAGSDSFSGLGFICVSCSTGVVVGRGSIRIFSGPRSCSRTNSRPRIAPAALSVPGRARTADLRFRKLDDCGGERYPDQGIVSLAGRSSTE